MRVQSVWYEWPGSFQILCRDLHMTEKLLYVQLIVLNRTILCYMPHVYQLRNERVPR